MARIGTLSSDSKTHEVQFNDSDCHSAPLFTEDYLGAIGFGGEERMESAIQFLFQGLKFRRK